MQCARALRAGVKGAALGAVLAMAGPALGQKGAPVDDAPARFKQAVAHNDQKAMASVMEAMLPSPDGAGEALVGRVIERGSIAQRAVATGAFARLARPEDVAAMAMHLDRATYHDERRWLVGVLGTRAAKIASSSDKERDDQLRAIVALIVPFVRDQDYQVRAAAMRALGDAQTPAALLDTRLVLPAAPGLRDLWADYSEQGVLTWATYACVTSLLGVRGESAQEVTDCLKRRADEIRALPPGHALPPADATRPRHFEVIERAGPLSDAEIDRAADAVLSACRPCFPGACLPPLRLVMTESQGLAKIGLPPRGFSGLWGGNTIGVAVGERRDMLSMLAHEYALTIHSAQFTGQPVWLMGGLALSLPISTRGPSYPPGRALPPELAALVQQGTFQTLIRWTGEATPNDDENARFHLGHLAVDYLRFRGYPEPEVRLNFLMGLLSRGASAQQALEKIYDAPVARLDDDVRAWVGGQ